MAVGVLQWSRLNPRRRPTASVVSLIRTRQLQPDSSWGILVRRPSTDLASRLLQVTVLPAIFTSVASLAMAGHTPLALAAAVCTGSTVGAYLGAEFALTLTESQLRTLYMLSLLGLGGRSLVAAVGNVSRLGRAYLAARKKGRP